MDAAEVKKWASDVGDEVHAEYERFLRQASHGWPVDYNRLKLVGGLEYALQLVEALATSLENLEARATNGGA